MPDETHLRDLTRIRSWKRALLGTLGGRFVQQQRGFPGNDYLAGISDSRGLTRMRRGKEENLLVRWLAQVPGRVVEFVCHPGYNDAALSGIRTRLRASREAELKILTSPEARRILEQHGIELISYRELSA